MSELAGCAEAFKALERAGWDARAETYDCLTGRITARLVEPLLDAAGVAAGMGVLDVGTGLGYAAQGAAQRGAVATGVDIAEEVLALARRRHRAIRFLPGDAEDLPFAEHSFDALVSNFTINHVPRPEHAIGEFRRVVVPGGSVALSAWDLPERNRILGILVDAVRACGVTRPQEAAAGPDPNRFADDDEFRAAAVKRGSRGRGGPVGLAHPAGADADELWEGMLGGSVRTAGLVMQQPPAHPQEDPRGGGAACRGVPCRRRARHPRLREDRLREEAVSAVETGAVSPAKVGGVPARGPRRRRLHARWGTSTPTTHCSTRACRRTLQGRRTRTADRVPGVAVPGPGAARRVVAAAVSRRHRALVRARLRRRRRRCASAIPAAARRAHRASLGLHRAAAHTARARATTGGVLLDTRLVSDLGEVAEHEPLVSTGWSGKRARAPRARRRPPPGRQADRARHELDRPPHQGRGPRGAAVHLRRARPDARRRSTTRSSPPSATATRGGW